MKSTIYTIKSKNNLYVGITDNFTQRKYQHTRNILKHNGKQKKLYDTIRQNGEWEIIILKEFKYENYYELRKEESRLIH
ncbi:MAG: GIY-YIG nuclease family protein, partial [Planctomycetota bacterium]